jgi:hypothetical protein
MLLEEDILMENILMESNILIIRKELALLNDRYKRLVQGATQTY